MIVYVVCCLLLWNAAEAQTTTSQLLTPVILTCTGTIDPSANQSASLTTQMAGLLGTTVDRVAGLQITFGELYDPDTYLMFDIFQLTFDLSIDDVIKLANLTNSKKLKLVDLKNNSLVIPAPQDLSGQILNYPIMWSHYPAYEGLSNFSCLAPASNLSKSDLLAKVVGSGRCKDKNYCIFNTSTMITKMYDNVSFKMCNRTRFLHIYRLYWPLNNYSEVKRIGASPFTECVRQQLVNLLGYSSNNTENVDILETNFNGFVNGYPAIFFSKTCLRVVNSDVLHFGESGQNSPIWKFSLKSFNCNGTQLWIPNQYTNGRIFGKLVVQTLSFSVIGNFDDITGYSESNFAQTLFSQLSTVMNLNATYFSDYQSKILQSGMATNIYFNISSFFQDKVIDITAANSTFYRLLNSRKLNLVDVTNRPLRIPNCTLSADPNLFQLTLLGSYNGDTVSSLSSSLKNRLAFSLNMNTTKLYEVDLVGTDLYDPETYISIDAMVFTFGLLEAGQLSTSTNLRSLVEKNFQLNCPAPSKCTIPIEQNFNGSVSYNTRGDQIAYRDSSNETSSMKTYQFKSSCDFGADDTSIKLLSDQLKSRLQVDPNIMNLNFNASTLTVRKNQCNPSTITIYPFKLTIFNDYGQTVGNDSVQFLSKIKEQLISLLKISQYKLLDMSVNAIDLPGNFNGGKTVLIPNAIRLTFTLLHLAQVDQIAFADLDLVNLVKGLEKIYKLNTLNLADAFDNALNIPEQDYDGSLKLPLVTQTISFAIMKDYDKLVGNDEHKLEGHLKSQLSKALDVNEVFLVGWHFEQLVGGLVASFNLSSYSNDLMTRIESANKTFYQLLYDDKFRLLDFSKNPLKISNLDDVPVLKTLRLIVFAPQQLTNMTVLANNWIDQLTGLLGVSVSDPTIAAGQLFNKNSFISKSVVQFSFNLKTTFTRVDSKMRQVRRLLARGGLILNDSLGNQVEIPVEQDLQANIEQPVILNPVFDRAFNRFKIELNCHLLQNKTGPDISSMASLLQGKLLQEPDLKHLNFNSTDFTINNEETCANSFFIVEPIILFIFNDYDQAIGRDKNNFTLFMESQLIKLSNSIYNENNFLSLQVNKVNYSDPRSGFLLRNVIQFSFVFLTTKINDQVTFLDNSQRLRYNNFSLYIPLQFKSGCTTNVVENRIVSIKLMITYDNLVASFLDDFVSNMKRQISGSKLLNVSTEFFNNHSFEILKDNYTAFHLNVSSHRNESVLHLQQLVYDFECKLKTTELVIKDYTGYPIHILLYNNTEKYLILARYGETNIKIGSAVVAAVILILSLIKVEIELKIKRWKKMQWGKGSQVFPANQVHVESRSSFNLHANLIAAEIASLKRQTRIQLESIIEQRIDQLANLFTQAENGNRANVYSLSVNESILPQSTTHVPEKAQYDAPI